MTNETQKLIPDSWDSAVHELWLQNNVNDALANIIEKINALKENKPKGLMVQLGYYLFLLQDYKSASDIFKNAHELYPDDNEIIINLAVALSRSRQDKESVAYMTNYLKANPQHFVGWDCLASSYYRLGNFNKSARAGKNSLVIKDKKYGTLDPTWSLPESSISAYTQHKKKVIAFSLWGNDKRYIFGALRNLLLAPDLYPDWELWFYVDNSVSSGFLDIIKQLNGKVFIQSDNQTQREKLCWRFSVANHKDVGYFLVRDVDSVFSVREVNAVQQWLESDKWFHIIRDWWTHTDLILAGLWGGVSGVLPDIATLLKNYSPNSVTTPNIDQWFLRDCIWRHIKTSCMIHDRCFNTQDSLPIPGNTPTDNTHIGSCEYHQRPEFQTNILSAWIKQGQSG